jgi:hypothetical protein
MPAEPLPAGLAPAPAGLVDERSRPDFRDLFHTLAARSTSVASAVKRVRLSALDLSAGELAAVTSFRVLVAELSVLGLDAEARALLGRPSRAVMVRFLAQLLEDRVLEVRAAPLGGWSPDFTVFGDEGGPRSVLTGFHWFERPYPHRGPALAALHGGDGARLAARRYDELWEQAHDVGPAIWSLLARAERQAEEGGVAGRVQGAAHGIPDPIRAASSRNHRRPRAEAGRSSGVAPASESPGGGAAEAG